MLPAAGLAKTVPNLPSLLPRTLHHQTLHPAPVKPAPCTSEPYILNLIRHTPHLTHHPPCTCTSLVTPRTSLITPRTSLVTPSTSLITPPAPAPAPAGRPSEISPVRGAGSSALRGEEGGDDDDDDGAGAAGVGGEDEGQVKKGLLASLAAMQQMEVRDATALPGCLATDGWL